MTRQPAALAANLSTGAVRRKGEAARQKALDALTVRLMRPGISAATADQIATAMLAALDAAGLEITEKTK